VTANRYPKLDDDGKGPKYTKICNAIHDDFKIEKNFFLLDFNLQKPMPFFGVKCTSKT